MTVPYLKQRDGAKKPSFTLPKGACDCHAHIIGDPAKYPFTANRSFTPTEATAPEYFALLKTLGFERMVIVQPSFYGLDNSCTVDAITAAGIDRARGIAMVSSSTTPETLRALNDAGIRGARFITIAKGGASLDQLRDVAELVAPLGWHLQLYIAADAWSEIASTVKSLPVEVVIDHMGQIQADKGPDDPNFITILKLLDTGRCWIKISGYRSSVEGYPYKDVGPLARRFVAHAPERCVWGTDWPHTNQAKKNYMPDDGDLVDLLREWVPDDATLKRILVTNPTNLYGFSPVVDRS